jgi:DTW domain-containing protein
VDPSASSSRLEGVDQEPRSVCERCRRPRSVCFCADLVPIPTRTRVLILQHPRERDVGIGTARLARLGLAGAVLRTDVDFSADPVVRGLLAAGNAYVLYPGKDAIDAATTRFASPITLVVLDGTWWQAEKLLKANPAVAALPRLAVAPRGPSVYGQIRREPAEHCVATLEAIAQVLGHLEGDADRFSALLRPLERMVQSQLRFATEVAANRHHRHFIRRPPRDPIPALLRTRAADLVCVHGEANAWPRRHPERTPPEIVHWLACRLVSGERFASVIAPRGRLAPSTCHHIRLPAEVIAAGESWPAFAERFRAFLRPHDVLVSWGQFPLVTLAHDGWSLAHAHRDARPIAAAALRRRTGTVEECLAALAVPAHASWAQGRGGVRLASLCTVVERLCAWPG